MAQKVRIILEDDLDGGPQTKLSVLAWTALTTKSICPPQTQLACVTLSAPS